MNYIFITLIYIVLIQYQTAQEIGTNSIGQYIRGINFAGRGYDFKQAYYLNKNGRVDPGYQSFHAFERVYQGDKSLSQDQRYLIPKNFIYKTKNQCSLSTKSQDVSSYSKFNKNLDIAVQFEYKSLLSSVSTNVEYQEQIEKIKQNQYKNVQSQAICIVHDVEISKYNLPNLDPDFKTSIQKILKNNSYIQAQAFMKESGTHITMQVELGSKYGYIFQLEKSLASKMENSNFSVEGQASYKGLGLSGKMGINQQAQKDFQNATRSTYKYTLGSTFPESNDPLDWVQDSMKNPMPLTNKLITFSDLFKLIKKYQKNHEYTEQQLELLIQVFSNNPDSYCKNYMLNINNVANCGLQTNISFFGQQDNLPKNLVPGKRYYQYSGAYPDYTWQKISQFSQGNYMIEKITSDETGKVLALQVGQDNRELKYGPNLVYKQPWETTFRTMLTSNALTKVNKYRAIRTISVGDNRVIIGIASSHKTELTFYWNYFTNDNKWKKVNMSSAFKYQDMQIDDNGVIVTRDLQDRLCVHWNMNSAGGLAGPKCSNIKADSYQLDKGIIFSHYQQKSTKSFYHMYDIDNVGNKQASIYSLKQIPSTWTTSGCATKSGWGYQILGHTQTMLYEDLEEFQQGFQHVSEGNKFYYIHCRSTEQGPIVFAIDNNYTAYYRKAKK